MKGETENVGFAGVCLHSNFTWLLLQAQSHLTEVHNREREQVDVISVFEVFEKKLLGSLNPFVSSGQGNIKNAIHNKKKFLLDFSSV